MNFANLNYFGKTATSLCGCCFYCLISRAVPHGGDEAAVAAAAEVTKSISEQDEAASY